MTESIIGILLALFAAGFAVWLFWQDWRYEKDERQQAKKQVWRKAKRQENARWYAETREADTRADLVRRWEELDV